MFTRFAMKLVLMRTSPLSKRDRDAGLQRVTATTRWVVAGALAGTGFFAGLASQAGRGATTATRATSPGGATARRTSTVVTAPTDDGYVGFTPAPSPQPPAVLPSSSNGFAPIVSGAS